METIGEFMKKSQLGKTTEKKRGGVTGPKSDMVVQLIVFMGEDKTLEEEKEIERKKEGAGKEAKRHRIAKRMKYWLGRTRKLSHAELYGLMRKAKDGKNQAALFNYLLKNHIKKHG